LLVFNDSRLAIVLDSRISFINDSMSW